MALNVSLSDIEKARSQISKYIQETQLGFSRSCSQLLGSDVYLKFENQQITGSFKIRGAFNKILSLSEKERAKGLIAASAGNHAQGVAYASTKLKAHADIVMPANSPIVKVLATQGYGGHVILHGNMYDESYLHAKQLAEQKGLIFVHPYEDSHVIAGQGTLGLELLAGIPNLDSVVMPIGGGGLMSGVALAIKSMQPKCKIFGAVSENAPGMFKMFKGEKIVEHIRRMTIADGIGVKIPSEAMYQSFIKKYVDDIITVSDDEIAEAIVFLLERAKSVVEGSAAITLAAAKKAKWPLGEKTCLVLSGGNIDLNIVSKVIERGLTRKGRLARIEVIVADKPGTLLELTNIIAQNGANILDVKHDRLRQGLSLSETAIEFLLELRSEEQLAKLRQHFLDLGLKC